MNGKGSLTSLMLAPMVTASVVALEYQKTINFGVRKNITGSEEQKS